MSFDWSMSIGSVMLTITLLVTLFGLHVANVRRMERLETKVNLMYSWFKLRVIGKANNEEDQ